MSSYKKLVVILGPTASGKTELALKLAKEFGGFIISADSRQIYKEMKIGTAKPNGLWQITYGKWAKVFGKKKIYFVHGIPHFMVDIIKPNEKFTVAQYQDQVYKLISQIPNTKYYLPFLVGGTGLYISAIVGGLKIPKVPPNWKLRKKIEKEIKEKGITQVYQKLLKLDPKAKKFIEPKNPRRIIRALEVCLTSGKKFSDLRKIKKPPFKILKIGIKLPKDKLYQRIDERVDKMIKGGLVKEVKRLYMKGYSLNLPSMSGIGYKQIGMHLKKLKIKRARPSLLLKTKAYQKSKIILNETIQLIKRQTKQFVKRQMTWFKRDKKIKWIKWPGETKKAFYLAKKLIKNFLKTNCP